MRVVGDTDGLPPRLAAKLMIEPNTGCLLWIGAASRGGRCGGYGSVHDRGQSRQAHRVVWEKMQRKGRRLPAKLTLDHVKTRGCASILCCAPWHLQPVSRSENNRRSTCHRHAAFRLRSGRGLKCA